MWPLLLVLTFTVVYLIQYWQRRSSYFSLHNIPSPPGYFLIGHAIQLFGNAPPLQLREWTKAYGKTYGIYEGGTPVLVTSDLHLLHAIFVKQFSHFHAHKRFPLQPESDSSERMHVFLASGVRWRRLRSITNSAFAAGKLRKLLPVISECSSACLTRLQRLAHTGQPFNIHKLYQEFSVDVIAHIAFGETRVLQELPADADNAYLRLGKQVFAVRSSPVSLLLITISMIFPELTWLVRPLDERFGYDPALQLEHMLKSVVHRRRAQQKYDGATDFIQLFLEADATEADVDDMRREQQKQQDELGRLHVKTMSVRKRLTPNEISMNLSLFLLAGFDTTSNTLGYTTYLLAMHQSKQDKTYEEISSVFQSPDEEMTYDHLASLDYLEAVIKETLRLYPHVSIASTRQCMSACDIGSVHFEPGVCVWPDVFSIHYDPEIWGDDAHLFRPERFQESVSRHPMAWMPFGAGPRMCQGLRLAMAEIKMLLSAILLRYRILTCHTTQIPLRLTGVSTLAPETVNVRLVPRCS